MYNRTFMIGFTSSFNLVTKLVAIPKSRKFRNLDFKSKSSRQIVLNALFIKSKNNVSGEILYLFKLDNSLRLQNINLTKESLSNEILISYPKLLSSIIESKYKHFILAYNHPCGICLPSNHDIFNTHEISKTCKKLSKELNDHLIWTSNKIFSFCKAKLL